MCTPDRKVEQKTGGKISLLAKILLILLVAGIMLLAVLLTVFLHFRHHHHRGEAAPVPAPGGGNLTSCDFFTGRWIKDESYPMYDSGECPFIEKEFNCLKNGRPDRDYLKFRWQPLGCDLASFDGLNMLEKYRGKNILFSGDSLTRDQYMSFVCLLYTSVPGTNYNYTRIQKVSTLLFLDYGIKVVMDRNSFLADLVPTTDGTILKLDSVARSEKLWLNNDLMIFNTLHWWTYRRAQQVWKYIQIGEKMLTDMDRMLALEIGLNTWAKWVDQNVDPSKSIVFFQGASPSHYSGKEWNEPNVTDCARVMEPLPGPTYAGGSPPALAVQKKVVDNMSVPVKFLDITTLSQLRIDAHPSYYGAVGMDCTHWCVAGVPDTWNQLLYNIFLEKTHI